MVYYHKKLEGGGGGGGGIVSHECLVTILCHNYSIAIDVHDSNIEICHYVLEGLQTHFHSVFSCFNKCLRSHPVHSCDPFIINPHRN